MPRPGAEGHDQPELNELISLTKAAELSGFSQRHLRYLLTKGVLWGTKMGRDWFTTARAVKEYLARDRRPGPKPSK